MKTAVSLPDSIFDEAELLAQRLKKSRSQLYAEALAEYLARRCPDAITEAMDRVCTEVQEQDDSFVAEAARRTLQDSEW